MWWFQEESGKKEKKKEKRERHELAQPRRSFETFYLEAESSCFKVNGLLPDNTDFCALSRGSAPSGVDESCRTESLRVDCEFRLRLPASRHPPFPHGLSGAQGLLSGAHGLLSGAVSNC